MNWTYDSLWAKAKLYAERAFEANQETELFPFWASLALEFLARAALAKTHPVLLADHGDPKNMLYAFGWSSAKFQPKSAGMAQVLERCSHLVPGFLEEHSKFCLAFANSRNEELHTGALAFAHYNPQRWLPDFFAAAVPLLKVQGKSLAEFAGLAEAKAAEEMLKARDAQVLTEVKSLIAAHDKVFAQKPQAERDARAAASHLEAEAARVAGGHMTDCPACRSKTSLYGEVIGSAQPTLESHEIVVRESVLPNRQTCSACGLHLSTHAQLHAAGLGGQFTSTTKWDPLAYYSGDGEEYNND